MRNSQRALTVAVLLLAAAAAPPAASATLLKNLSPRTPPLAKRSKSPPPPLPSSLAPSPKTPSGRCSFCANVTVLYPSPSFLDKGLCSLLSDRIKLDLQNLYDPAGGKLSPFISSHGPRCSTVSVCSSVRTAALAKVGQAALDGAVYNWAMAVRGHTQPYCVPLLNVVAQVGGSGAPQESCLYSRRSYMLYCDAKPSRAPPPPSPPPR